MLLSLPSSLLVTVAVDLLMYSVFLRLISATVARKFIDGKTFSKGAPRVWLVLFPSLAKLLLTSSPVS